MIPPLLTWALILTAIAVTVWIAAEGIRAASEAADSERPSLPTESGQR